MLLGSFCIVGGAYASPKQTLNYYVVEDISAPFQITQEDAKHKGYISDIVEELSSQLDIELITHVTPSPRIEMLLKDENVTDWIVYDSPAWNSVPQGIPLETPVLKIEHSAIHCGHSHDFKGKLKGHSFAVLKHFRYPGLSELARQGKIELTPVKSYEQGFELVDLDRVDGFIEMDTRLKYNLATQNKPPKCTMISGIGDVEPAYELILVVSKTVSEESRNHLNDALLRLKKSGFFEAALKKYTH